MGNTRGDLTRIVHLDGSHDLVEDAVPDRQLEGPGVAVRAAGYMSSMWMMTASPTSFAICFTSSRLHCASLTGTSCLSLEFTIGTAINESLGCQPDPKQVDVRRP